MLKSYKYQIQNLDCANCARKIEEKLASTPGYKNVRVNFNTQKLIFSIESSKNDQQIQQETLAMIQAIEPEITIVEQQTNREDRSIKKDIVRLAIGIFIAVLAMLVPLPTIVWHVFMITAYILIAIKTAQKAVKQVKNKVLDENTLIMISAIGAYLVDKPTEGLMVVILYEIGKILESKAIGKSRKSIQNLMDIQPEYANLKQGDTYQKVAPETVKIGDILLVKAGEKIPLDGSVVEGEASINNAALTGESMQVTVGVGDKVLSGGINTEGLLVIQVEKTYENSTVSKILELVENATDKKAKTETFVSKAAKIYTPVVLLVTTIVAIGMPLLFQNVSYAESIYKALIFLVIACPCSIAISVPLSYFSGIGKASQKGILVKGSDYLDGLKEIRTIIFDKTGTITTGKFQLESIRSLEPEYTEKQILTYLALGESFSNHPIAISILEKVDFALETEKVENLEEIAGKGIQYQYKGETIRIGNEKWLQIEGEKEETGTVLYIQKEQKVIGKAILKDQMKKEIAQTIQQLKNRGIQTKMFTGDRKEIALEVAQKAGIEEAEYEMLPNDKYAQLETILQQNQKGKVAFVGDGINDSPVLARADIGISMGGVGSSSAIEASDVVIMTDEIQKIIEGMQISKKTGRIITQNLVFAIATKLAIFVLSLLGFADMWQAVFADVGVTLLTILNTLRILR